MKTQETKTLADFCAAYGVSKTRFETVAGGVCCVIPCAALDGRPGALPELFRLRDFTVASISGGSYWLTPRARESAA